MVFQKVTVRIFLFFIFIFILPVQLGPFTFMDEGKARTQDESFGFYNVRKFGRRRRNE